VSGVACVNVERVVARQRDDALARYRAAVRDMHASRGTHLDLAARIAHGHQAVPARDARRADVVRNAELGATNLDDVIASIDEKALPRRHRR